MGSAGNLVTSGVVGGALGPQQRRRSARSRATSRWILILLAAALGAAAGAAGTWVALSYTPSELADVMRIPTDQVFDQQGRERLGVDQGGLLLLVGITPSALIGGLVAFTARLRGWWMLAPPVVAVALGLAGSAAALTTEAGPVWQVAATCAMAGVGACLGVAISDGLRRPGP